MIKSVLYQEKELFYKLEGEGPPVLLVHGLAEDHTVWDRQTGFLSAHFQVLVPDLPGSGQSALLPHTSMEELADAVKAILDAESIAQTVMIGHSMGGYVTLAFAEQHPHALKTFGLFHSTAYADSDEKKTGRKRNMDFLAANGTLPFLKQATPGLFSADTKQIRPELAQELIDRYSGFNPDALVAYNQAMLERPDRTQVIAAAPGPVLFVMGGHDTAVPLEQSLKQAHLANVEYIHILKKSAHMGFLEESDESNQLLKKFLDDVFIP